MLLAGKGARGKAAGLAPPQHLETSGDARGFQLLLR